MSLEFEAGLAAGVSPPTGVVPAAGWVAGVPVEADEVVEEGLEDELEDGLDGEVDCAHRVVPSAKTHPASAMAL